MNNLMISAKKIHVHYVAMLREHVGTSHEEIDTTAHTIAELYGELLHKHHLPVTAEHIRPAINDRLVSWQSELHDKDRVTFLPPSSGG